MASIPLPSLARLGKWFLALLIPLALVGFLLHSLGILGRWSRDILRDQERYQIAPADIDCTPPAALSAADFLAEVQYLAGLPDQLPVLDGSLPRTLATAFVQHPWVESVRRVEMLPGRKVRVELVYRIPVLAVPYGKERRAIDAAGVLLPRAAATKELPVYVSAVAPPRGGPGTIWQDPLLPGAAQIVAFLREAEALPRFAQVESAVSGLALTTPGGSRVLWGRPGGTDAVARRKRDRLVDHCKKHGDLDHPMGPREHDLRSQD